MYLKPSLSAAEKLARVAFVVAQTEPDGVLFQKCKNKVHLDETWYCLDRNCLKVLLFPGQELEEPRRTQHKAHITKVMMLTAIGMPHQRPDGSYFDGKIGSWPVVEQVPARRNSINRPAGTLETKSISMTSAVYVGIWNKSGGIRDKIRGTSITWYYKFSKMELRLTQATTVLMLSINTYSKEVGAQFW